MIPHLSGWASSPFSVNYFKRRSIQSPNDLITQSPNPGTDLRRGGSPSRFIEAPQTLTYPASGNQSHIVIGHMALSERLERLENPIYGRLRLTGAFLQHGAQPVLTEEVAVR